MRMDAVHSEYEVVVLEESSAPRCEGGSGGPSQGNFENNTCLCGI